MSALLIGGFAFAARNDKYRVQVTLLTASPDVAYSRAYLLLALWKIDQPRLSKPQLTTIASPTANISAGVVKSTRQLISWVS